MDRGRKLGHHRLADTNVQRVAHPLLQPFSWFPKGVRILDHHSEAQVASQMGGQLAFDLGERGGGWDAANSGPTELGSYTGTTVVRFPTVAEAEEVAHRACSRPRDTETQEL